MADTAIAITAGSGTNVDTRTEGTNGNHRQVIVIGDPATNAGVAPVDVTAGLKVDLGADNDVTVTSGTITAVTAITNALPAGTNAIGKLAANSGVDIGDVDVTSIIPGTGATNLGKAVDSVAGATDTGAALLVVRDDALTTLTPADGDYTHLRVSSTGALHVTGSAGATEYTEDAAAASDPVGGVIMGIRRDSLSASEVSADGDNVAIKATSKGQLHVLAAIDSTQLGSLGQAAAASSAPVVVASDRMNSVAFSVAMTTDTGAYASGDLIADTQQLNGFFNKSDGKGVVNSITLFDREENAVALYVLFHQTSTSMGTENSAPNISDANAEAGILGIVAVSSADWVDIGTCRVATIRNIGLPVSAASGTDDLYASIVNGTGTPTYTGGNITMIVGGLLD